jgi:membrane protein implicated in regulation of membrane protease activity
MSTTGGRDRARRLVLMVGVVVLGLAVALGVFIQSQARDPRPPEDVPRALAIPALYATVGLLAIIGALQRRRAIVVAAGILCLVSMILSVATIEFAVPGVLLIVLGSRIQPRPTRHRSEAVIAAAVVLLVVSAAVAVLVMTEGRCWQATGSPADPTYTVIPCGSPPVLVGGGQTFASGFDSGVLTTGGGLVEAALLLGALTLVTLTGRTPTSTGVEPSLDQAPPR